MDNQNGENENDENGENGENKKVKIDPQMQKIMKEQKATIEKIKNKQKNDIQGIIEAQLQKETLKKNQADKEREKREREREAAEALKIKRKKEKKEKEEKVEIGISNFLNFNSGLKNLTLDLIYGLQTEKLFIDYNKATKSTILHLEAFLIRGLLFLPTILTALL